MTKRQQERLARLLPGGIPRYVRCYDNGGETVDRYTVVYTGNYNSIGRTAREPHGPSCYLVVGMSEKPFHPLGFCQHSDYDRLIDWPTYRHLGKKIKFGDLPEDCQVVVLRDYRELWNLEETNSLES